MNVSASPGHECCACCVSGDEISNDYRFRLNFCWQNIIILDVGYSYKISTSEDERINKEMHRGISLFILSSSLVLIL